MRLENGAMFTLLDVATDTDGEYSDFVLASKEAYCRRCSRMLPGWYPKPAPAVSIDYYAEPLEIDRTPVLILHEALVELLEEYWPDAVTTRCFAPEGAQSRVGDKYFSMSLPEEYYTDVLYPLGHGSWVCYRCKRCMPDTGTPPLVFRDPYICLRDGQDQFGVLVNQGNSLVAPFHIREKISKLGVGVPTWKQIPVYTERLPHHQLPNTAGPESPTR